MGRRLATALTLALALLAPAAATGALADREQVHLTAEGQAAARAALPKRSDFGAGWTAKSYNPKLDSDFACASYNPKQSDLVRNGAAGVTYTHPGIQIDTETQVLATARMVALDWQRTVLAPEVVPCLQSTLAKTLPASASLVSSHRLAFPKVATYTNAFRVVIDVHGTAGTVRMFVDVAVFGRGRTEITMSTTAPFLAEPTVRAAEVRLARLLAARVVA